MTKEEFVALMDFVKGYNQTSPTPFNKGQISCLRAFYHSRNLGFAKWPKIEKLLENSSSVEYPEGWDGHKEDF